MAALVKNILTVLLWKKCLMSHSQSKEASLKLIFTSAFTMSIWVSVVVQSPLTWTPGKLRTSQHCVLAFIAKAVSWDHLAVFLSLYNNGVLG